MPYHDIPDHPVIRNMERTGYPDGKEPEYPHCPVCGAEEIADVYVQDENSIAGCAVCVTRKDAEDVPGFRKNAIGWHLCPVCGRECEDAYVDKNGDPVGCDACVDEKDAWEQRDCFHGSKYD